MPKIAGAAGLSGLALGATGWLSPVLAHAQGYGGYYGGHMWDGDHMWGGGMYGWFLGPLMMIVWIALIVGAVVLVLRLTGVTGHSRHPDGRSPETRGPDAMDILRERFARGEIDKAEFEERRALLERRD